MRKLVAILGPPERWAPLCREYRQIADFIFASPVRASPNDDSGFSLFLVDLLAGRYGVLVATCPTVIESMVDMAAKRQMLDRMKEALSRAELIVIGERTSSSAERHGIKVSSVAPEATTDSLVEHINRRDRRGTIALLRSDQGSKRMVQGLSSSGWEVENVPVYTLLLDEGEAMQDILDRLGDGKVDMLVFPTPAHAQAFLLQLQERCGKEDALSLLTGMGVAAMGRETSERLEGFGISVSLVPEKADALAMVKALVRHIEG